jgi:hypothetical protein
MNESSVSVILLRGAANKTDKTHVKELSSINNHFKNYVKSLENNSITLDFQFQNYSYNQSIKIN